MKAGILESVPRQRVLIEHVPVKTVYHGIIEHAIPWKHSTGHTGYCGAACVSVVTRAHADSYCRYEYRTVFPYSVRQAKMKRMGS